MKTEQEFIDFCLARLSAEGIEAFTEMEKDEDGEECGVRVRVPQWENDDAERSLSFKAIYSFIHAKLDGNPSKSLQVSAPGLDFVEVYCYYPPHAEAGKTLNMWDIRIWSVEASLDKFDWTEIVEGDDTTSWWEGWDAPTQLYFVSQRHANLATFLNYQIIDTPPVPPLSRQELVNILKKRIQDSISCLSPNGMTIWPLRLTWAGELVLHKPDDESVTVIKNEHFDERGRLVVDGAVALHRCNLA